jgi:hypothetical protein
VEVVVEGLVLEQEVLEARVEVQVILVIMVDQELQGKDLQVVTLSIRQEIPQ